MIILKAWSIYFFNFIIVTKLNLGKSTSEVHRTLRRGILKWARFAHQIPSRKFFKSVHSHPISFQIITPIVSKMARFTSALLASLVASAAAFAPSTSGPKSTSLNAIPVDKEVGVLPPMGFFE